MAHIPTRPTGASAEMLFHQAVWDRVFGRRGRIISVPGQYDVSYTEQGIIINLKIRPGGGKAAAPVKAPFDGVYVPGASYDSFHWVVVQNGPVNGSYISTADGNTNAPWTGINWIQFATQSQWF